MKIDNFVDLINHGHEIEFKYKNKMYSITYGIIDNNEVISFCEFDKESIEVSNVEDLLKIEYNNVKLTTMIESLHEGDIWIY